jgi:cyclophilin family peptidyl-prolyl cis-trans isomerase
MKLRQPGLHGPAATWVPRHAVAAGRRARASRPAVLVPALAAALLVASCGGGSGGPSVTSMAASPVAYGRTALWNVTGLDLLGDVTLSIRRGQCDNVTEIGQPSATQRQFTCRIASLGALEAQVDGGGKLASLSVDVPVPTVRLTLAQGTIDVELDPVAAPVTVNNFLDYVNAGFYDATLFHRVISGFVIQGGGYTAGATEPVPKPPTRAAIALESNRGRSNLRGTIAMARSSAPDSATSQYYFNMVDNLALDYVSDAQPGYAVFGQAVAGLDVVDAIAAVPTHSVPSGLTDVPVTNVVVTSARQIR